jgi:flagellar biosynthesis protein FlhF
MKIKRFFAPDMRTAMRNVREAQGADAVILSNRQVDGGIEVISAVDFDQEFIERTAVDVRRDTVVRTAVKEAEGNETQAGDDTSSFDQSMDPVFERNKDAMLDEMRRELRLLRSLLQDRLQTMDGQSNGLEAGGSLWARLRELGLTADLAQELARAVSPRAQGERSWYEALDLLAERILITQDDIVNHGGRVALLGPTGSGKTTTIAKLAARFALRHGCGHVALVTTDTYRIGAQAQLETFGSILGVPVHKAASGEELGKVLERLADKRLVLIDNAGLSHRDLRVTAQLRALDCVPLVKPYLVVPATRQQRALEDIFREFGQSRLAGCILTKLDETSTLGELLSVLVRRRLPVAYICDGQGVPDDIHPARVDRLLELAVQLVLDNQTVADKRAGASALGVAAFHSAS